MNKKKVIGLIALAAVLALALTLIVACNKYKQDSVPGGDASAEVTSNGGYVVRQGDWVYFINGYVGDGADNEWGNPLKQSIMRAPVKADGSIDNDSARVVVPKSIYNKSAAGGFAVFGNWIYYATPNNDKDKGGTPSTTHTDFMRTSLDGTITQLIGTINSRESEFLFTPTRVLYRTDTATVSYFDFSKMKTDKSIDNGKGVTGGTLISNATSIMWNYDPSWAPSQGVTASDYVFYTEKLTGDNSYEFYNKLCCVRYDGSDRRVLATYNTYLTEEEAEDYINHPEKVFNFSLIDTFVDGDDSVTLYYTKSINLNSTSTSTGLYVNKFDLTNGFSVASEKKLVANAPTSIYPLGYEKGALILSNGNYYYAPGAAAQNGIYPSTETVYDNVVVGKIGSSETPTVQYVSGKYVYYTGSTSDKLYRINFVADDGDSPNGQIVFTLGIKTDWLSLEFLGDRMYFFTGDDYSYVHYADLNGFTGGDEIKTTFIGRMTSEDAEAKKKAEEEKEEAENNK